MGELTIEQQRALALARARLRAAGREKVASVADPAAGTKAAVDAVRALSESQKPSAADPFKVAPKMDVSASSAVAALPAMTGEELLANSGSPVDTPEQLAAFAGEIGDRRRAAAATPINSKILGIAQGGSLGFGDEIGAAMIAPFSDANYAEIRDALRGANKGAATANPGAYYSGQILGALPTGGSAYNLAEKGLKAAAPNALAALGGLPARVGLGSATGAVEGAVYGAGTADGGDIAQNMKENALIGGLVGAAAPAALAGVGAAAKAVWNPIQSMLNIPSATRASSAVEKVMRRAGMTADDVTAALRTAASEGQPMFNMADALGSAGQRAMAGVARQPGDARQIIAEALMRRQGGQSDRISAFLADALDAGDTAAKRGADMADEIRKKAKAGYDAAAASAAPVDVRPVVASLDDTINQMRGSGINPPRVVSVFDDLRGKLAGATAKGEPTTLSDYKSVLALWREVKDDIDKAFRAGDGSLGEALKPIRDQLEEALSVAAPGFRAANAEYRAGKAALGALEDGKAAASPRVRADDTVGRVAGLNDAEKRAFAAGYADPLIGRVESAAPGVNKARPLSNEKTKAELAALAKDPALLERQVARENAMFETNVAALGGSKTADNLADIADTQAMSASVIGNLLTGNWGSAGRQLADKLVSGATGSNEATRKLIAEALLSQQPQKALAAIQDWRAVKDPIRKIIESLARSSAIQAQ